MKNKWFRVIGLVCVGFVAYSVGSNVPSIVGDILIIVGVILVIGGIVEIFKKKKPDQTTSN
jgi:hypothetical protein